MKLMTVKKFFKIFEILREPHGPYKSIYLLESAFAPMDVQQTREQCEQVIEYMGMLGMQYAIVEVWEKEREPK